MLSRLFKRRDRRPVKGGTPPAPVERPSGLHPHPYDRLAAAIYSIGDDARRIHETGRYDDCELYFDAAVYEPLVELGRALGCGVLTKQAFAYALQDTYRAELGPKDDLRPVRSGS